MDTDGKTRTVQLDLASTEEKLVGFIIKKKNKRFLKIKKIEEVKE
jgi:hypothetical protein